MDFTKEPCPHRSVPVEMDERMTATSLELAWPAPCSQCSGRTASSEAGAAQRVPQFRPPESRDQLDSRGAYQAHPDFHLPPTHPGIQAADDWCRGRLQLRDWAHGTAAAPSWPQQRSVEEALEAPLPLMSDVNYAHPPHYPAGGPKLKPEKRQCLCCPPANPPAHSHNYGPYPVDPQQGPPPQQPFWNPSQNRLNFPNPSDSVQGSSPRGPAPPRDVMHEVSVEPFQAAAGATWPIRKTVSLPEECRNVFITYSLDTVKEILIFTKFLVNQGFRPAIDVFHNPLQTMSINKWMDTFLNDKSVIIIVVISPKYKEDVEGNGDDEHGLHTKYIHNQIQNEFIQQGCLNFRLVPVLFPNATMRHVPTWLRSTRIYHWPRDTQDLVLRLLREERYVIPQRGDVPLISVRPL